MIDIRPMRKDRSEPLQRAIKAAGGLAAVAAPFGITKQAISRWAEVPAERVLGVERVSGVSRHELRPDLYPVEPEPAEATA